jgi:hypothetical protein
MPEIIGKITYIILGLISLISGIGLIGLTIALVIGSIITKIWLMKKTELINIVVSSEEKNFIKFGNFEKFSRSTAVSFAAGNFLQSLNKT